MITFKKTSLVCLFTVLLSASAGFANKDNFDMIAVSAGQKADEECKSFAKHIIDMEKVKKFKLAGAKASKKDVKKAINQVAGQHPFIQAVLWASVNNVHFDTSGKTMADQDSNALMDATKAAFDEVESHMSIVINFIAS